MAITSAGTKPRCTSGYPNAAVSQARTRSHAVARPHPPPSARPRTAATTGFEACRISRNSAPRCWASVSAASSPPACDAAISSRSAPAQKSLPAPRIAITRTDSSPSAAASASRSSPTSAAFRAFLLCSRCRVNVATPAANCRDTDGTSRGRLTARPPFPRPGWRPRPLTRIATSSGTSISMRSRAVLNTFPCASVIRETVPPPSRAPWRRKFTAQRLASSKRSTGPLTRGPKYCFNTFCRNLFQNKWIVHLIVCD